MERNALQPQTQRLEVNGGHDFQRHQRVADQGQGQTSIAKCLSFPRKRGGEHRVPVLALLNGDKNVLARLFDAELVGTIHGQEWRYVKSLVDRLCDGSVAVLRRQNISMTLAEGVVHFVDDRGEALVRVAAE